MMELKRELFSKPSKSQIIRIVNYIGNDRNRFAGLVKLFLGKDEATSRQAAWAVSYCVEFNPELAKPYLGKFVKNLFNPGLHDAIKRNTMRLLQFVDLPAKLMGELTDLCFNYLGNVKEAIAVRVFSMTVLLNIAKKEPGLKNEINLAIKKIMQNGSGGIRARGRK